MNCDDDRLRAMHVAVDVGFEVTDLVAQIGGATWAEACDPRR